MGINFLRRIEGDVNLAEIALLKAIDDDALDTDGAKIQKLLHIKKAAVSQMLGALEKKGYLIREINPDNRRKLILTLTDRGRNILLETDNYVDSLSAQIIKKFGEKETRDFIQDFDRLAEVITRVLENSTTNSTTKD
jgi:DNA-binding MarR family transcriptional regulator